MIRATATAFGPGLIELDLIYMKWGGAGRLTSCTEEVWAGRDGNVEISTESLATLADARNDAPVIEAQEAIEANLDDITATISGQ